MNGGFFVVLVTSYLGLTIIDIKVLGLMKVSDSYYDFFVFDMRIVIGKQVLRM